MWQNDRNDGQQTITYIPNPKQIITKYNSSIHNMINTDNPPKLIHTIVNNTTLDEIFDVQDDLVQKIVYTIVGRVEADSVKQLTAKPPDNRTAYDLVLQGLEHHRKAGVDKEHAEQAVKLFEQAIEVDPNYARAYAWRACSLAWNVKIMGLTLFSLFLPLLQK